MRNSILSTRSPATASQVLAALIAVAAAAWIHTPQALAKVVRYELTVSQTPVNMSGKQAVDWALMINGSIPAPTLEFTEGDEAEIVVINQLKEEVSIHWHGILLPPEMDGVAYVNTPPILGGGSHTFRFKFRQHGTYWYHSHTGVQEQKGLYGALVIHSREKKIAYDDDLVVVLSDWSDENATQILRNLRKDGDYYLYKKDSMRSWWGAIQNDALDDYLYNEWTRMGGMDLSDVGYDAFLINGRRESQLYTGKPGRKLRIRIINAAASSYFYVALGQEPMRVIAADGVDIEPIMAKELLMGMAETYDVLYEVPQGKSVELRATVQDVTGHASGWIGEGAKIPAPDKPMPDMYARMDHGAHHAHHDRHANHDHHGTPPVPAPHASHDHHAHHGHHSHQDTGDHSKMDHAAMGHGQKAMPAVETLTVDALRSPFATAFAADKATYELKLVLGGDMERYIWHINGKAIHEDRTITVREGDIVRFIFANDTMMHHPMHLHGHFFRVVNAHGAYAPLKHTVDVPPHGTRVIEFMADEPGEWMLHCHNLYHMKTGMARVVKYSTFTPKPEVAVHQAQDPHLHDHLYFDGALLAATNGAEINLRLSRTWDTLEASFETHDYEDLKHATGDLHYRRWLSKFFNVLLGASHVGAYEREATRGVLGMGYTLPMLVETDLMVDHRGKLRLDLEKRFQWTKFVFTEAEVTLRQESQADLGLTLMYASSWHWAVGLTWKDDRIGAGAQFRF